MKKNDFRISFQTVWFLIIANLMLTVLGAFAKIGHWAYPNFILIIGLVLFFSTWIIIFNDIVKNKIRNKAFWIISMLALPFIAAIFYMVQRNRLIILD